MSRYNEEPDEPETMHISFDHGEVVFRYDSANPENNVNVTPQLEAYFEGMKRLYGLYPANIEYTIDPIRRYLTALMGGESNGPL